MTLTLSSWTHTSVSSWSRRKTVAGMQRTSSIPEIGILNNWNFLTWNYTSTPCSFYGIFVCDFHSFSRSLIFLHKLDIPLDSFRWVVKININVLGDSCVHGKHIMANMQDLSLRPDNGSTMHGQFHLQCKSEAQGMYIWGASASFCMQGYKVV